MYPESGLHLLLNSDKSRTIYRKNVWTQITEHRHTDKKHDRIFREHINIENGVFIAPRSGLYYISLYLHYENSYTGKHYLNITVDNGNNRTRQFVSKIECNRKIKSIHMNEVVQLNNKNRFMFFIMSSNDLKLSPKTTLSVQFISSYVNTIGFISYPKTFSTISNENPQYIIDWVTDFVLTNGFSKATGTFVVIKDGYYLIVLKLIFKNIIGKTDVFIYENGKEFFQINNDFKEISLFETVTYTGIRKLSSRSKISLKILASTNDGIIADESSYSILFMSSTSHKQNLPLHHHALNETIVPHERKSLMWETHDDGHLVKKAFQIARTGYYFILVDMNIEQEEIGKVDVTLDIDTDHYKMFSDATGTRFKVSIGGVFFLKSGKGIECHIKPNRISKVLKRTSITIYEIAFQTDTSLFSLSTSSRINNEKGHFLDLGVFSEFSLNVLLSSDNKFLKIFEDGIYYVVLNILTKNETTEKFINVNLRHRNSKGEWKMLTECLGTSSSNCFLPVVLFLKEGDWLAVWQQFETSSAYALSILSSITVQFLKHEKDAVGFCQNLIKNEIVSGNLPHRVKEFGEADYSPMFLKNMSLNGEKIIVPYKGVYFITANIIIRTQLLPRITLKIKVSRRTKSQYSRQLEHTTFSSFSIVGNHYLQAGDELKVEVSFNKKNNWEIYNKSIISIVLLTTDEQQIISVETDKNVILKSSSNEIWKRSATYGKMSPYLKFMYGDGEAETTFVGLLSLTLTGEIKMKSDKVGAAYFINVHMTRDKHKWEHLLSRKHIIKRSEGSAIISLQLSGIIVLHPGAGNIMEVEMKLSDGIEFYPSVGSTLSVVVLEEIPPKVADYSYLLPASIPFQEALTTFKGKID